MLRSAIKIEDAAEISRNIRVGDRITYDIERECERRGNCTIEKVPTLAFVVAKYPHLIQVGIPGDRQMRVKTITYNEIAIERCKM